MLSRWKLMAGVLGVSIGGLAAAASQCPKWDKSKGRSPETPVAKADMDPKLPPAGAPATLPPAPEVPPIPAPPQLTPAGSTLPTPTTETPKPPATPPSALPPVPEFPSAPVVPVTTPESKPTKSAEATPPALPPIPSTTPGTPATKPESKPTPPTADLIPSVPPTTTPGVFEGLTPPKNPQPTGPAPMKPEANPNKTTPTEVGPPTPMGFTPNNPPGPDGRDLVGKPNLKPVGATQPANPGTPVASPPNVGSPVVPPASGVGSAPAIPPVDLGPPLAPQVLTPPAQPVQAAESKFRIILRVGEGEPTFEVKNGDNLMLKVACDKVDIKSPEKGGLSEVTARGKVRFAGFGAEGTCDELKFLAGTGEVSMTGDVKVQVKDKLGRVESELSTGTLKYKIDASAVGGQLKP